MAKLPNPMLEKASLTNDVIEAARALVCTSSTIRNWIKDDLEVLAARKSYLILGQGSATTSELSPPRGKRRSLKINCTAFLVKLHAGHGGRPSLCSLKAKNLAPDGGLYVMRLHLLAEHICFGSPQFLRNIRFQHKHPKQSLSDTGFNRLKRTFTGKRQT